MKILVALAFVAIVGSLVAALAFMVRARDNKEQLSKNMARSLALRVALSIALFASILIAWKLGFIEPTGRP